MIVWKFSFAIAYRKIPLVTISGDPASHGILWIDCFHIDATDKADLLTICGFLKVDIPHTLL